MKARLLYILVILLVHTSSLYAQQDDALSALSTVFADNCVALDADYVITISQTRIVGKAYIEVQGSAYMMRTDGMDVYCDGETVWTIDDDAREVYIEVAGTSEETISENVLLSLINSDAVDLSFDETGRLCKMKVSLPDSTLVSADILSFQTLNKKTVTSFRPQHEFGADWIVTDLR